MTAEGANGPTTPAPVPPPSAPQGGPHWVEPLRPPGSIAWAAYSVLAFAILVNLAYLGISFNYADAVQTQIDERSLTLQEAYDAEDAFSIAGLAYLASTVAATVGFLLWWYRAYSNLPAITGQPARFGRGWAIGAWFVPILNLWRPKQIGNDIWRAGAPEAIGNERWRSLPVSQLVHWWWAVFLLAGFIGAVGGALLSTETVLSNSVSGPGVDPLIGVEPPTQGELDQEYVAAILVAISSVLEIVAAVLAISFVTKAGDRQDAVISAIGATPPAS